MIYEFENKSGDRLELYYPVAEAPPIGTVVNVEGVEYRRIPSLLAVRPDDKPVISNSSPRWHGMKVKKGGFYRNYTPDGKPVIDGRAARKQAKLDGAAAGEIIRDAREMDD